MSKHTNDSPQDRANDLAARIALPPRCFELLPNYQPHGEDCLARLISDLWWRGRHLYLKKRPSGNLTE